MAEKRKRPDIALLHELDEVELLWYPEWYIEDMARVYEEYRVSCAMLRRLNDVTRAMRAVDDGTDAYAYYRRQYSSQRNNGVINILTRLSFIASSTATLFYPDKQDIPHQEYMNISRTIDAVVRDLVAVHNADKNREVKRIMQI